MKITDVECLILDHEFPFVRVHTNEGMVGIGECFRRQPQVVKTLVDYTLKPILLGKDPLDTEVRWQEMARGGSASDMGGAAYCAIAGLDIALWDLKGKALEDLGVFHFEEPRPHYDLAGLAAVADALDIPIASGEMIYTHWQYRDLILQGRVDILQPDIVKAPGFTEFQKIAALASAFGKPMTVHNTQPTISTVAHLHVCAAYANIPYAQEYNIEPTSIRDEWPILREPLEVVGGYLEVPDGPELGVDLDEAVIERLSA